MAPPPSMATVKERAKVRMAVPVRDPTASRTQWGGAFLAAGLVLSLVSFTLVLTLGQPPSDAAARAQRWVQNASTVQLSGWLGVFGNALIAAGALFLVARPVATRREIPASACWLLVAIGALLFVGLDAFKAGALVPLAQGFATNQGVYLAAEGMRSILVGVGMTAMSLGTAFIFLGEADASHRAIPTGLSYAAAACSLLTIVGALGVLAGVPVLGVLYYLAYVTFLSALFLGVKVAWLAPVEEPTPEATFSRA